jgi:hypothetical protein
MDEFANAMTKELENLRNSNDIDFLRNELKNAEELLPECAAESLWRTNKIQIIKHRLNDLRESNFDSSIWPLCCRICCYK